MVALQILVLPVGVRILLGERKTPNTHRVRFFFRIGSLRLSVRTKDSQSLKTSSTLVGTEARFLIYCKIGKPDFRGAFTIHYSCLYRTFGYKNTAEISEANSRFSSDTMNTKFFDIDNKTLIIS